jgi:hypothetical protein
MLQIQLSPGLPGGRWAYLRPLCGHDEVWINDASRIEAVAFLDRLLVEAPGTTVGSGKAEALAICDCDRLYAALYLSYFGEQIEGIATCRECGEPFEISLSLPELMADLEAGAAVNATRPDEAGIYTLLDNRQFRLPTAGDQQSVTGLQPEFGALQDPGKKRRHDASGGSHTGTGDAGQRCEPSPAARHKPGCRQIAVTVFEEQHLGKVATAGWPSRAEYD